MTVPHHHSSSPRQKPNTRHTRLLYKYTLPFPLSQFSSPIPRPYQQHDQLQRDAPSPVRLCRLLRLCLLRHHHDAHPFRHQRTPPPKFISFLSSIFVYFFGSISSQTKFVIEENSGFTINEVFQAAEFYLRTKITPSIDTLKVSKTPARRKSRFPLIRTKKSSITSKTFASSGDLSVP